MRKRFKKFVAVALVGLMCVNINSFAETTESSEISDLEDQKEDQEQKLEQAQAVVDQLKDEQGSILDAIATLDVQLAEYNTQLIDIQNQKAELEVTISDIQTELEAAKELENEQYEAMKKRIQYSYENGDIEYIDTIFASTDISDIANQQEYAEQVYNYDSNLLQALVETRKTIANKEILLQTNMAALEDLEAQVTANQQAVEVLMTGKTEQVNNYTNSIDSYETQVAEYQAGIDALDSEIEAAEAAAEAARLAKIKEQQEAAKKKKAEEAAKKQAAQSSSDDTASDTDASEAYDEDDDDDEQLYYDVTYTSLQWPVSTGGVITSEYGPRWGSNHNGLDIGCDMYTPIVAAESGTVILSTYDSSAGNYIIIDHGGGLTTVYMHNSELLVSVGDEVVRGQVIAYSGSTGWSTGPHCHIGVRVNGEYVDPYPYLVN